MLLEISEILKMSAEQKKDVFVRGIKRATEGRYEAIIALTSLHTSGEYQQLDCSSVQMLAAEQTTDLTEREVRDMISIGTKLVEIPELDQSFRDGVLSWSKVRALIPVVTRDNFRHWIAKAKRMSSNRLEREVGGNRDPVIRNGMVALMAVTTQAWQRYQRLAECVRRMEGDATLADSECFEVMLDELEVAYGIVPPAVERGVEPGPEAASPGSEAASPGPEAASHEATAEAPGLPLRSFPSSRHIPAGIRRKLMVRAKGRCEVAGCGNSLSLEMHHFAIHFAQGGAQSFENLQVVCSRCHTLVHKKRPERETTARHGQIPPRGDGRSPGDVPESASARAASRASPA